MMRTIAPLWLALAAAAGAQTPAPTFKFDFGSEKPAPGYTQVPFLIPYSNDLGYGFEPDSPVATSTFYFSIKVPVEGNYKVTVTTGGFDAETITTIKAELRRLMVEKVRAAPGKFETRTFIVNVRRPQISTGGEVRLKDREKTSEARAWDDKLTLEFTNRHPAVSKIEIEKADNIPTIYIAGDSTSTDQPREPFNSWGQMLPRFFKPDIAVANHGESGESLRDFIGERRLEKVMSVIKPGDYLFIQMGHNDQKEKGEGVGAFTTYKADLKRFIAEARQHGATPVLVTPVNRLTFGADGKITNSLGDYPEAVRRAGKEEGVAVIDLNAMSKLFYEALGPVESHKAFAGNDTTHHSDYGSYELAKCIVEGIRQAKLPLVKFLTDDVAPFDPAHPDPIASFDVPAEPMDDAPRPYGDTAPQLRLPEPANPGLPSLFLIGDSTVRNGRGDGANGQWGWGEPIAEYFDAARINVVNRAVGGLSSRTYLSQGYWERVLALLKKGDFVMMQFGHNDEGPTNNLFRARGSLQGTGDETQEVDNQLTGQHEVVHSFGWYLRKFISDARASGATPIVCSLIPRKIWKGGRIARNSEDYGKWAADVAASENAPFVDLNRIVAERYDQLGQEKVEPLFADPHTHTSRAGAELNSECVVAALKGLKSNPLAPFFTEKAAAVVPYAATAR